MVAIFHHTWLSESYTYINVDVSVDVATLDQCAVFSQRQANMHNAFNFQLGKCGLYMLPALRQNSEVGVGVFRRIKNLFNDQQTAPVNPPTRVNLALGECI